MSVIGQSFTGSTAGARIDFGVGAAANVFTGAFTVVCLAKMTSSNWGMLGGFSDSVGGTMQGGLFISNNSGGRLYSNADFSNGYPDSGVDADGINDGVWRWHAISKPAGAAHYRFHYADLATLTWSHGESVGAANHGDMAACVAFSTWAVYAMGFNSGDMAALAVFGSELSDSAIAAACTQLAQDLANASPAAGWLFPEASSGSAVPDFTGGGADESFRQLIATSPDPAQFDFTVNTGGPLVDSGVYEFADAGAGKTLTLPSAPSVGDWDVLCVNSDTTVSTPSGFTLAETDVGGEGAYIFTRQAVGGEGSTVVVTTSGDHNTLVQWSRWTGLTALDTSTHTSVNGTLGGSTPTHSTGTLAESGEVVIAFGATHAIQTANQNTPVWSSGYTGVTTGVQGTGGQGVRGFVAYKTAAGTAAEAPQVSWSGDTVSDRYMLAVSFTTGGGGAPAFDASRFLAFFH